MQNLKKNIQSLTQTTSKPFLLVGQIMNKNASRYPANSTHRSAISVEKCHSSDLIFKIIMEIQVHGNLTIIV